MSGVTQILAAIDRGEPQAAEQLLPLVYDELRKLAAVKLREEKPGQTLQATALVHEAYLRLVGGGQEKSEVSGQRSDEDSQTLGLRSPTSDLRRPTADSWHSRGHFFAAAAEAMRRILVEAARRKQCQRHGAALRRCDLLDEDAVAIPISDELLDLDAALSKLATIDPQAAELVKLRVFAGMTVEETAAVLDTSPRTVKRNWAYARAWLGRELAVYGRDST